jgi:NAD(P)-dependent dehydrogenase (short-subunit alcohol dehydrogenase family)
MIRDKVVIINGAVGRLGRVFADSVLRNNGKVVIADIDIDETEKFREQLAKEYNKKNIFACYKDITLKESIEACIQLSKDHFGKIDAIVNNAYPRNKNYGRHFFDVDSGDFNHNLNMHLGGYFLACQLFSKFFIGQGYGNIINISSIYSTTFRNL